MSNHCKLVSKIIFLVAAFVAVANASKITILDSTNLSSEVKSHDKSLVMFEAPWCPQCHEGMPHLEKTADERKDLFVARLDCETRETNELCNKEKVEAYPTVRLYRKGKDHVDFPDEITKEKLNKFLENPEGYPKVMEAEKKAEEEKKIPDKALEIDALRVDLNQYQAFVTVESNVFILYYAPWCPRSNVLIDMVKKVEPKIKKMGLKIATCNCDIESHRDKCREKMTHLPMVEIYRNGGLILNSEKFFKEVTEWNDESLQSILVTAEMSAPKSRATRAAPNEGAGEGEGEKEEGGEEDGGEGADDGADEEGREGDSEGEGEDGQAEGERGDRPAGTPKDEL